MNFVRVSSRTQPQFSRMGVRDLLFSCHSKGSRRDRRRIPPAHRPAPLMFAVVIPNRVLALRAGNQGARCLRPGALYREGICFCLSSVDGLCQGTTSVVPQLRRERYVVIPNPVRTCLPEMRVRDLLFACHPETIHRDRRRIPPMDDFAQLLPALSSEPSRGVFCGNRGEGSAFGFSSVRDLCQGTTSVVPQLKAKAFGYHPEPSSDVFARNEDEGSAFRLSFQGEPSRSPKNPSGAAPCFLASLRSFR
jgi:hypothetical protein